MNNIKGKTVLITGAAVGLGYKYAEDLLRNGAKSVAILDLASSKGDQSAVTLEKEFGKNRAIFVPCDVSNASQFEEAVKKVISTFNVIDIFINNAGILDESKWIKTIDINVTGLFRGCFLALDHMSKNKGGKGGTIVNIASIVGISNKFIKAPVYTASKHAVVGFSNVLKNMEEKTGVRVLIMCPGVTETYLFQDVENKFTKLVDIPTAEFFQNYPKQTVDNVSQAMMDLIEKGKNGAIWVSEGGQPPYQIEIPHYTELVVPIMQIKDKRAIVTGAASKLGLAFSRELLRNGATKVLMIDNREEEGKGAMERLNFEFGRNRAIFLPCDVTRSTDFNITFKDAINILGGLDILINNASVINEADFVKAIDVNVTALIRSTLLGIQQMRRDSGGKGGVVLNVSSIAGLYALPQLPVYSTAKHAVVNFSRSFAQPYHYQRTKVRIIVLCPGVTEANHEDFRSNLMDPQVLQKYQPQRVESVAHGLVYAIRCAQNGTIWISEQGKPVYEVQLSDSLPQKTDQGEEQQSRRSWSKRNQPVLFPLFSSKRSVKHQVILMRLRLMLFDLYKYHSNRAFDLSLVLCDRYVLSSFFFRFLSIYLFRKSKMEMMALFLCDGFYLSARRMIRRRSSGSERAKELEEINGVVSGKNILITGGAAGLGYAFVNSFLKYGANKITILDIDGETCKRIGLGIEKSYGVNKVYFIQSDVAKHEQSIEAFEEASILMTEIDIVINNAGILDERRWEREIAVNITGMISTAMLAVKHMSKESGGHGGILVNVSEHMNIGNTAQLPVYAATKHAIIGLSQSLADPDHYERTGIRVITLCPGLTETGLTIDSPNKLLSRVMKADFVKNLEHVPIQTPYIVAQGLLNVLRFGESGSIWVIESGRQPYEIYVPNPRTLRRRYKNNMSYVETKIGKGRKITKVYDNSTRTSVICV
ncbi:uncharacterized protein LOC124953862 [Vespa velutina]|uniref:uncharacterized protein LOC124953862 n=1 Tax=Vespa velutina TaxID=202808 RepID=UPI001FB29693|nr:uncharacterized protein LOC124953862 [Vespa velutina]